MKLVAPIRPLAGPLARPAGLVDWLDRPDCMDGIGPLTAGQIGPSSAGPAQDTLWSMVVPQGGIGGEALALALRRRPDA